MYSQCHTFSTIFSLAYFSRRTLRHRQLSGWRCQGKYILSGLFWKNITPIISLMAFLSWIEIHFPAQSPYCSFYWREFRLFLSQIYLTPESLLASGRYPWHFFYSHFSWGHLSEPHAFSLATLDPFSSRLPSKPRAWAEQPLLSHPWAQPIKPSL